MILREALRIAGAGIIAGWIAAAIGGRWLQSLLYDTSRTDPLVLGSAAALMLTVALVGNAASRARGVTREPDVVTEIGLICVFVILASAMTRWVRVLNGTLKPVPVG